MDKIKAAKIPPASTFYVTNQPTEQFLKNTSQFGFRVKSRFLRSKIRWLSDVYRSSPTAKLVEIISTVPNIKHMKNTGIMSSFCVTRAKDT